MSSVTSLLKYVTHKTSRLNLVSTISLLNDVDQQNLKKTIKSFSTTANVSTTTKKKNSKYKKSHNSMKTGYIAANDEPSDHYVPLRPSRKKEEYVKQPFQVGKIPPGDWDKNYQNPLYRPKFKNQAKLISKEDFERQPMVGVETTEYKHITDSQIILSWMTCDFQEKIYSQYTKIMLTMQEKYSKTSHEYVNRLLASRFNITPERCAAIIQLQYNQNQYELRGERVQHELGYLFDSIAQREINEIYDIYDMVPPPADEYIEEVAKDDKDSKSFVVVDDAYDLEQMTQDLQSSDDVRADILINQHPYIVDVDDSTKIIPIDKDCITLVNAKTEFINEYNNEINKHTYADEKNDPTKVLQWKKTNWKGVTQRPRWKFVLQTTNTRNVKKKILKERDIYHKKNGQSKRYIPTKFKGGSKQFNVLIEDSNFHYVPLRQARYDEMKYCSFKHNERHLQEFSYRNAKLGWLNYTLRNDTKAWGVADLRGENFKYNSNNTTTDDLSVINRMYQSPINSTSSTNNETTTDSTTTTTATEDDDTTTTTDENKVVEDELVEEDKK